MIRKYEIDPVTYELDIFENFNLSADKAITQYLPIKIRKIEGDFRVSELSITSCKNFPISVAPLSVI